MYIWQFTKITDHNNTNRSQFSKAPSHKYKIKCTHEIKGHKHDVVTLNWTNTDDSWIVTGGVDKVARIWDTKTAKPVCEMVGHTDKIQSALFTSDDKLVVTLSVDRKMIIWSITEDLT